MGDRSSDEPVGFLHRPVAIVSLIGGILGIVTGAAGVFGLFSSDQPSGGGADAKIEQCMAAHGLSNPQTRREMGPDRLLFRACAWPPPFGAESDGFMEITAVRRSGPGNSEAEGLTAADVVTSECRDLEIVYLFDDMGTFVVDDPIRISKGEIRRVEGGSVWHPRNAREASVYTPRRDEVIVMANERYKLDRVRCI